MEQLASTRTPADLIIAHAVHQLTSFPPTPQYSADSKPSPVDIARGNGNVSTVQHDQMPDLKSALDDELVDEHQTSSVVHPTSSGGLCSAIDPTQQSNRMVFFLKRQVTSDDDPATSFKYRKPEPSKLNLKPHRGLAGTQYMPTSTSGLVTAADMVVDQPATDSHSRGAVALTSQLEAYRPQSPRSEPSNFESPELSAPNRQALPWPRNPEPDSHLKNPNITPTATISEVELAPAELDDASHRQIHVEQDWSCEPGTATAEGVHDHSKGEKASSRQERPSEDGDDWHDGDTEMLDDGQTLVDVAPASHASARSTSTSPSSSPPHIVSREQASEARESHDHEGMRNQSLEMSIIAAPQAVDAEHEMETREKSLVPSEIAHPHRNEHQDMDPERILKILTVQVRHQQQHKGQLEAREKARKKEVCDIDSACRALDQQLKESEDRVATQEEELAQYRQLLSNWQGRVTKLGKFVNGLANDHSRLRDAAQAIQKEQQNLRCHKDTMRKLLEDTEANLLVERTKHKETLLKARYDTKLLEQALDTRNLDLLQENARLRAEQGRSERLQDILAQSASYYEAFSTKLAEQEAAIGSKILVLCEMVQSTVGNNSSAGQEDLMGELRGYLTLLKESRGGIQVNTDDIRNLSLMIEENNTRLSHLATKCGDSMEAGAQLGGRLATQFDEQIQKVLSVIETGHLSQNQIVDLRETKAKIAEKLSATEKSLAESHLKATSLAIQEQLHLQKISALDAEVNMLRHRQRESPLLALRLHDSEKGCTVLKEQLATSQTQLDSTKARIEAKDQETLEFRDLLEATKAELHEQRSKAKQLSTEKAAVEAQAVLNEDAIRAAVSKASQDEITRRTDQLQDEIKGLQYEASVTAKAMQTEKSKMKQLQVEKSAALENADRLESSVSDLRREAKTSQDTISRLKQGIEVARQQEVRKDERIREVDGELREMRKAATHDSEISQGALSEVRNIEAERLRLETELARLRERYDQSKEALAAATSKSKTQGARIQELLEKLAVSGGLNTSSSSSPLRSAGLSRSSERQPVVVEDSQGINPKQRRSILKPVVEDSQEQAARTRQGTNRPLSSDELNRGDPLSYMPKEVRDLVLASSSPLSDVRRTSSPVLDGGAMFPPSPGVDQGKNPSSAGSRRLGDVSSHGPASSRESSVPGTSWAFNASTTNTMTQSVTASLYGRSPSRSGHFTTGRASQPRAVAQPLSRSSGIKTSESQSDHQPSQRFKNGRTKRVHMATQLEDPSMEDRHKRRRLSSEIEKLGLGPTQSSPATTKATSQRKSTLRRTQPGDKYSDRFTQELKKGR